MTEERKISIPVVVDGTGAKPGFDQVKQSAQDMAQGVAQSAKAAGQAIDGIGTSSEKLNATQGRMLESIKRTTIGTVDGKAALKEYQAAQAGIASAAAPYIAKLREAEQGQVNLGMSAKATAAALRGVPAQFTDIITSLQGGQKPITVLLQQGGQLKDMFGGVGGAAKALGGYVLGLVNPYTLAAGAAVALALAYQKGADESNAYSKALILSGNAAGTTAGQLQGMATNLAGVAGSQSAAAAALAEFAQAGTIGRDKLEAFTASALKFEKATGQAIGKTVESFSELARSPLDATVKLNEKYNYLTLAVYQQIKALEDQGKATQAADVAQKAFADTIDGRSGQILQNLGLIERAWNGIKSAITGAASAAAGIGRPTTNQERLATNQSELARLQNEQAAGGFTSNNGGAAFGTRSTGDGRRGARIQQLEAEQAAIAGIVDAERVRAEEQAKQTEQVKARIGFDRLVEDSLNKQEKLARAIAKAEAEGAAAGASRAEINKVIANERKKFQDTSGDAAARDTINADIERTKQALAIKEELTKSSLANLASEYKRGIVNQVQFIEQVGGAEIGQLELRRQSVAQQLAEAEKLKNGKTKVAELQGQLDLADIKLAERKNQLARDLVDLAYERAKAASLFNEAEQAQGRQEEADAIVAAAKRYEALQLSVMAYGRSISDANEEVDFEVTLLGKSAREQAKLIELHRIDLGLREQMRKIEESARGGNLTANQRQEAEDAARASSAEAMAKAEIKVTVDEWKKAADSINASLTDALLRGFEAGKSFAQNLRDTLVNMFKTLVLRPIIQAVLSPISGSISQTVSSLTGAGGAGGIPGLGSIPGLGGSAGALGSLATIAAASSFTAVAIGKLIGLSEKGVQIAAVSGAFLGGLPGAILGKLFGKGGGPKTEGGYAPTGLSIAGIDIGGNMQGSQRGDVETAQAISKGISDSYAALAKQLGLVQSKLDVGVFFSKDNAAGGTSLTQLQLTSSAGYDRGARLGGIENVARGDEALKAALAEETTRLLIDGLKKSDLGQQYKDILNALTQDAGTEAMQAAVDRIATAKEQQKTLEATLFDLTATDTEKLTHAREAERAAIDPLNKALLESVYVQQDLAAAAAKAANVASERYGLETQLLQLQGNTTELRARELAKLDESNRAIQQRIYDLQDESAAAKQASDATQSLRDYYYAQQQAQQESNNAAAQAAQTVRDAWKQAGTSIGDYIKQLTGELTGNKAATLAGAQGQFAIATAQARAGDQKAADSLPTLAKALQELALGASSTRVDYSLIVAATLASLQETLGTIAPRAGLPSFDVGTPFVQQTGTALIHQGEAILPAVAAQRWRDGGGNQELVAEVRLLRDKLEAIEKNTSGTARSTARTDQEMQRMSKTGFPVINQPDTVLA